MQIEGEVPLLSFFFFFFFLNHHSGVGTDKRRHKGKECHCPTRMCGARPDYGKVVIE